MRLIYDINDVTSRRRPDAAARWTAIIPAAGRGGRLNSQSPKILYPVLGRPILEWLVESLQPLCRQFVFVVSPEGQEAIAPRVEKLLAKNARTVVQENPTGMADAIALAQPAVKSEFSLVTWGDQVTTRPRTISACMTVLETSFDIHSVIPTIFRDNPYIDFVRDVTERVVQVYEARESDQPRAHGENDCGSFLFRSEALFRVLKKTRGDPTYIGAKTKEQNFLSLLPLFHDEQGVLATVRIHDPDETLGINTPYDAEQAGRILKNRR